MPSVIVHYIHVGSNRNFIQASIPQRLNNFVLHPNIEGKRRIAPQPTLAAHNKGIRASVRLILSAAVLDDSMGNAGNRKLKWSEEAFDCLVGSLTGQTKGRSIATRLTADVSARPLNLPVSQRRRNSLPDIFR